MTRRQSAALLVVVVLLAIIGWTTLTPLRVWYLTRRLEETNRRVYAALAAERTGEALDVGSSELFAQKRRICDGLVAAGYFFHETYQFDKVPHTATVYRALVDRWMRASPKSAYATFGASDYVLDVYDLREAKPRWDAFVRDHNVADFVERFAAEPPADVDPPGVPKP
jgi:hypothetical protein